MAGNTMSVASSSCSDHVPRLVHASLIDRSVERLDSVRLKPMLDAMERWIGEYEIPERRGLQLGTGDDDDAVRELRAPYLS